MKRTCCGRMKSKMEIAVVFWIHSWMCRIDWQKGYENVANKQTMIACIHCSGEWDKFKYT